MRWGLWLRRGRLLFRGMVRVWRAGVDLVFGCGGSGRGRWFGLLEV